MEPTTTLLAALAILVVAWISSSVLGSAIAFVRCLYHLNKLKLPGFRGDPAFGAGLPMILLNQQKGLPRNIRALQGFLGMCTNVFRNESIVRMYLGVLKPIVFLCKSEAVEVLLSSTKEVKKSREYEYISDWLGDGLITSPPDIWRRHRKLLTPTFNFRILDGFQPIMNEHGDILVDILKEAARRDAVSVEIPVTMCTLDIISETALGIKLGAQLDRNSAYVQSILRTTALMTHRILSPWLWTYPTFWLSPTGRELSKHLKVMNTFLKKAHDTVAMATYWAMYYLGLYPDIQNKAHEEVDRVLQGDSKRSITADDLKQLEYLERVIKESQRLTPAVPTVLRILQDDLNIDGVVIPKGTTVAVFLLALQRDPSVYPNPEVFDPDRFLDNKKYPFSFIPFSAGPRSCLGQKYAALCLKTLIANLLRNLSWKSLDPLDRVLFNPEFAIRPSIPIRLNFESRV